MTSEEYLLKRIDDLEKENKMLDNHAGNVLATNSSLIKKLEEKDNKIVELNRESDNYRSRIKRLEELNFNLVRSLTPVKIYHHKERGNTSVKFLDGEVITVKRMKGDKDCLETALAYAITKKLMSKRAFNMLIKNVVETGGR